MSVNENNVQISNFKFQATESSGKVSGILMMPQQAECLLVLSHGAGAGMHHFFMESMSKELAQLGIATFRYQFPYMEQGKKRPDPPGIAQATIRSAIKKAHELADDLPFLAGGKSFGGRMTSSAASKKPLPFVKGLVFFGFPLHAPGKPSVERGDHLFEVTIPMLFQQGTRDSLAKIDLIRSVCDKLGNKATLQIIEGGDHSFKVPKSSGRNHDMVIQELAEKVAEWIDTLEL